METAEKDTKEKDSKKPREKKHYAGRIVDIVTAAEHCGLTQKTLYNYVSSKKVPHVKIGRAVRFELAELDKWLDEKRVRPVQ